jgi:hypothetical protein
MHDSQEIIFESSAAGLVDVEYGTNRRCTLGPISSFLFRCRTWSRLVPETHLVVFAPSLRRSRLALHMVESAPLFRVYAHDCTFCYVRLHTAHRTVQNLGPFASRRNSVQFLNTYKCNQLYYSAPSCHPQRWRMIYRIDLALTLALARETGLWGPAHRCAASPLARVLFPSHARVPRCLFHWASRSGRPGDTGTPL